ncbi:MAG: A24 family peptidase [Burkholderiaceae bacterium]
MAQAQAPAVVTSFIDLPAWLVAVLAGILGLLIGSFLNVVIYRLPRIMRRGWAADAAQILSEPDVRSEIGLSGPDASALDLALARVQPALEAQSPLGIAQPRSRCSSCGHPISAIENIPIASWLVLRGRCRACKARISARYPIVEATLGLLFALAALQFGLTPKLADAMLILALCVAMTLIDADTMLLPDALTQTLVWSGILVSASGFGFVALAPSVIGAAAGYGAFWMIGTLFRLLRGMEGMGAGDYKLLAGLGAWFGWSALLPIVLLSAGVGSLVGITLMLLGRATALTRLPFGVYLAPAGALMLFFGHRLISWVVPGAA